jgi:uncharacterized protein (DUF934 family)
MKFITATQDPWHLSSAGEDGPVVTLTPTPHSLLTLIQWHSVRSHWPAHMPVGVTLKNDDPVADLRTDLPRLALLALQFPKWVDGRAYSQAKLLRSRWHFAGEIRATGEVVVDMLPLLQRTGFDSVVLRHDQSPKAAQKALTFFPGHYQGDATGHTSIFHRITP